MLKKKKMFRQKKDKVAQSVWLAFLLFDKMYLVSDIYIIYPREEFQLSTTNDEIKKNQYLENNIQQEQFCFCYSENQHNIINFFENLFDILFKFTKDKMLGKRKNVKIIGNLQKNIMTTKKYYQIKIYKM